MNVKFTVTEAERVDHIPVQDGQVIALWNKEAAFYDMNDTRYPITGVRYFNAKPDVAFEDILYIIDEGVNDHNFVFYAYVGGEWIQLSDSSGDVDEKIAALKALLEAQIQAEASERETADIRLNDKLDDEISEVSAALQTEESTREAADTSLGVRIDAETQARTSAVAAEASARTSAVAAEASARTAAIAAEASAREAADTNIWNSRGAANGFVPLNSEALIDSSYLPSYVDDILEGTAINAVQQATGTYVADGFTDPSGTPYVLESSKIYIDLSLGIQFRWTGSATLPNMISIGSGLVLGTASTNAYRGDHGLVAYRHATDAEKEGAESVGFYKLGSTADGHVKSLTPVTKDDIVDLIGGDTPSGDDYVTLDQVINALYPVGSVYMTMGNVNPSTFLNGTTWTKLTDGYLKTGGSAATGGSLTTSSTALTVAQMPSHSHTGTSSSAGGHTHNTDSQGNHSHTSTTQTAGSHSHTTNSKGSHYHTATTQNTGGHTHTATTGSYGNHTHTLTTSSTSDHTHIMNGISTGGSNTGFAMLSVQSDGNMVLYKNDNGTFQPIWSSSTGGQTGSTTGYGECHIGSGYNDSSPTRGGGAHSHTATTQNTGAHTHTLTTGSYGSHAHTLTTNTTGDHTHTTSSDGNHSHTLTTSTNGSHTHTTSSNGSHTHTLATSSVGSGQGHTHTIEPTFTRIYAWQRTA